MKIFHRLSGVLLLKPNVYKEIIDNASLWKESAVFIIIVAFANGFFFNSNNGFTSQSIARFVAPIIAWILSGYLCSFFLRNIYKVDASAAGVMKIFGYAQPFMFFGFHLARWNLTNPYINLVTSLLGGVLVVLFYVAIVIGIREMSRVSSKVAIIVTVISFFIILIFQFATPMVIEAFA